MRKGQAMPKGFEPLFDSNSKILILGSFPSVKSRQTEFYYGNKQNRFWKTLQSVFGGDIDTIENKKQLCLANGIALWDIVESCDIVGSADANIKNYRFVDLDLLLKNTNVCKILCNGTTAYKFTIAAYHGDLPVILLPSTSPANTRFDKEIWTKELSVLITE